MKFLLAFISVVVMANVAATDGQCASLGGPMIVPNVLPKGVLTKDICKCAGHPVGNLTPIEQADQSCWYDSERGCTKGYCWKVCGNNGEWCWTANNGGLGSWITCKDWKDCSTGATCGIGGAFGGCSCNHD